MPYSLPLEQQVTMQKINTLERINKLTNKYMKENLHKEGIYIFSAIVVISTLFLVLVLEANRTPEEIKESRYKTCLNELPPLRIKECELFK